MRMPPPSLRGPSVSVSPPVHCRKQIPAPKKRSRGRPPRPKPKASGSRLIAGLVPFLNASCISSLEWTHGDQHGRRPTSAPDTTKDTDRPRLVILMGARHSTHQGDGGGSSAPVIHIHPPPEAPGPCSSRASANLANVNGTPTNATGVPTRKRSAVSTCRAAKRSRTDNAVESALFSVDILGECLALYIHRIECR